MSHVLSPSEIFAPPISDPTRWAPIARPVGQTALYLYPGDPTPVASKPYAELLGALDTVSQNGDSSIIEPLLAPGNEGTGGMLMEFELSGLDLVLPRTLPQLFSLAVEAGHLSVSRSDQPKRLFTPLQLRILDYAALGYRGDEIPELANIEEPRYRHELELMGQQADCGPGLLRLLRKAAELQARIVEFSLTPPNERIRVAADQYKAILKRSGGLVDPEITLRDQYLVDIQDKSPREILDLFGARSFPEVITKAILLELLPLKRRKPSAQPLDDQQVQLLALAAQGNSFPEIEKIMGLGPIDDRMTTTIKKLGADSIEQAVLHAFEDGTFVVAPTG